MGARGQAVKPVSRRIDGTNGRPRAEGAARLLRTGAVIAITGQLTLLVASALHPAREHPADHRAVFTEYAESASWTSVHLLQWLGGILVLSALAVLAHHVIQSSRGRSILAYVALGASVTVAAVFTVLQAIDGVALKMAVDAWVDADPASAAAAFSAAEAIRWTEIGVNGIGRVLQGIAVGALALAAVAASVHGRTLAVAGVVAGVGVMAGGLATAYTGFSTLVAAISMGPLLLQAVWVLGVGVVMWRRAAG